MTGESIKYVLAFMTGLTIGAGLTYKLIKEKYENIADAEIKAMKEYYSNKYSCSHDEVKNEITEAETVKVKEKPKVTDYVSLINKEGYSENDGDVDQDENEDEDEDKVGPYVITPEEFCENEDYEVDCLTHYADGYLVDDNGDVIEDVEELLGDAISEMGKYEDDAIHVCDDDRKCYYEILEDMQKFS